MSTELQYYLRIKGEVSGPYTRERVQLLIARGRINRHFEMSEDRQSWHLLADDESLFEPLAGMPRKVRQTPILTNNADGSQSSQVQGSSLVNAELTQSSDQSAPLYYFIHGDQACGPESLLNISQMIGTGQIPPQTLICPVGHDQWQPFDLVTNGQTNSKARASTGKKSIIFLIIASILLMTFLAFAAAIVVLILVLSQSA